MSFNKLSYNNRQISIEVDDWILSNFDSSEDEFISAVQYLIDNNLIIEKCTLFSEEYLQEYSVSISCETSDLTWERMLKLDNINEQVVYYGISDKLIIYSLLKFIDKEEL